MENRTEKNIRLVALDLDETTLQTGGNLSEYTRHALEEADRNGIQIVAASGRGVFRSAESGDRPFRLWNMPSRPNGANIYEVKTGKRVMAKFLEKGGGRPDPGYCAGRGAVGGRIHRRSSLFPAELCGRYRQIEPDRTQCPVCAEYPEDRWRIFLLFCGRRSAWTALICW